MKHLAIALLIAVCAVVSGGRSAEAAPNPMTRDEIIAIGKTVVGFSYWWGGGKWKPGAADKGKCTPTSGGGCPSCTHSGAYGADCSGFVAKAWQIDKPTPLDQGYHPYSTWHFDTYSYWWTKIAKGSALRADAFNYNKNGAGHIFLYDKGDPWGSVYAWECKGCAYGCVYNLRSVSADYSVLRRKLISEAPKCTPHCEGSVMVGADCGKGDCAAYGATCANDELGLRCVSIYCPAKGTTSTCLPDPKNGKIATCKNGALSDPGDCSAYGAMCSTKAGPAAKCVSAFCAASPAVAPTAGALCYQGKRYVCASNGDLSEAPCPSGQPCQTIAGQSGPGSGSCGPAPCANCDDGNPCTADTCNNGSCVHTPTGASCNDGNACTDKDMCSGSACFGQPKDCADGAACTADSCVDGACKHSISEGVCDDGNVCTADSCGTSGCVHSPTAGACDDGDGCTSGGGCKNGACKSGELKVCEDFNGCTGDSCLQGECVHQVLGGLCDDGDACTEGDYCAQGQCLSGASLSCDDGLLCTLDSCIDGKCQHLGSGCGDATADSDTGKNPKDSEDSGDEGDSAGLASDASSSGQPGLGSLDTSSGGAAKNQLVASDSGCTSGPSGGTAGGSFLLLLAIYAVRRARRAQLA